MAAHRARHARSRCFVAAVSAASLAALLVALTLVATANDGSLAFVSLPLAATGRQSLSMLACDARSAICGRCLGKPPALTRLAASGGSAEIRAEAESQKALNKLEGAKVKQAKKIYPEVLEVCPPEKRADIELIMLRAFGRARKCREAEAWFGRIIEEVSSLERNVDLWRALLDSYAQLGRWKDTERIARQMQSAPVQPDHMIYGVRMHAFAKGKRDKQVAELFSQMKQAQIKPDEVKYGTAMGSLGRTGQFQAALRMLEEIKSEGVQLNAMHYSGAMNACAQEAKRKPENRFQALELLAEMRSRGVQPDMFCQNAAVNALARAGDVDSAKEYLEKLEDEGWTLNYMSYNPVMKALADKGDMEEAEQWLKEMRSKGVEANAFTYNALLSGHATRGEPQESCRWLQEMQRYEVRPDIMTLTEIVRAHAIAGDVSGAFEWLDRMPDMDVKPNTVTYNVIATQLSRDGGHRDEDATEMAENLLRHMSANGVWPNKPTSDTFRKILGKEAFERLLANLGMQVQSTNDVRQLTFNKMNFGRNRRY